MFEVNLLVSNPPYSRLRGTYSISSVLPSFPTASPACTKPRHKADNWLPQRLFCQPSPSGDRAAPCWRPPLASIGPVSCQRQTPQSPSSPGRQPSIWPSSHERATLDESWSIGGTLSREQCHPGRRVQEDDWSHPYRRCCGVNREQFRQQSPWRLRA